MFPSAGDLFSTNSAGIWQISLIFVVYLGSLASSIIFPRPTSHSRACRDYGHRPSSTGPIADDNRSLLGYPGFRAKGLHACAGSLTPRVRYATRDIAAHRCCLPYQITRSALELGDFGAQLPCLHAPCQRFAAALTRGRRMTRGHGWSLTFTMQRTCTAYPLPTFTGAFELTPILL